MPPRLSPAVSIDRTERLMWKIQRIAWWAMAGVIIPAALLGVFGAGRFAAVRQGSGSDTLAFERVMRLGVGRQWQLHLDPNGDTVRVHANRLQPGAVRIDNWSPTPNEVAAVGDELIASFLTRQDSAIVISFRIVPKQIGRQRVGLAVGSHRWDARVLVLP